MRGREDKKRAPIRGSPKWTNEIEEICEKLRINCVNLSEYHRKRYYHFKSYGKYFRLPLILLASINSTASVGLQTLVSQEIISGITCLIGMVMGIISAVELYMGIQTSMELELKQSKDFYSLAIDIYKTLSLQRMNRGEDGKDYLNKMYGIYVKLCEASQLLRRKLKVDMLTQIPKKFEDMTGSPLSLEESEFDVFRKYQVMEEGSSSSVEDTRFSPPPPPQPQPRPRPSQVEVEINMKTEDETLPKEENEEEAKLSEPTESAEL